MRLRHIEVFHAVMQTGSINAAARLLNVSQPAATQVLKHAEGLLGYKLFDRERGRLVPTVEARTLYAEAQRAVDAVEDLRALAGNLKRDRSDHIRIAATHPMSFALIPRTLARLTRKYGNLTSEVRVYHRNEIVRALLAHDVEIGFTFDPPIHPGVLSSIVGRVRFVAAIHRQHNLARMSGPVRLKELQRIQLVRLYDTAPPGLLLRHACQAHGVTLQGSMHVQTSHIALSLAESLKSVALVDSLTAASFPRKSVVLRPIAPDVPIQIAAHIALYREHSKLIGEFQRAVSTELNTMKSEEQLL